MYFVLLLISLFGVWFVFSGFTSLFFLVTGALTALFAVFIVWRMELLENTPRSPLYTNPSSYGYIIWLFYQIWKSSLQVSKAVWSVHPRIHPKLSWIDSKPKSDVAKSLLATSITLTPGTVCIDVNDKQMLIHALEEDSIDVLRAGAMETKVIKTVR